MGEHLPELCTTFHRAIELIGKKWTGAIIYLLLRSRCRFAELRNAIPDITDRMLSERLQELEEQGIVTRTVVPEPPVRVEYELTKKGRALAAALDAVGEWAHKWANTTPDAAKPARPAPAAVRRARKPQDTPAAPAERRSRR
jgi:DNA-binding HxlR family transcriptional regulator